MSLQQKVSVGKGSTGHQPSGAPEGGGLIPWAEAYDFKLAPKPIVLKDFLLGRLLHSSSFKRTDRFAYPSSGDLQSN
jgi:hypothetical protein